MKVRPILSLAALLLGGCHHSGPPATHPAATAGTTMTEELRLSFFETFDDAHDACDVNYPLHPSGERQEITDRETSEQWWRSDGDEEWRLSRRGRSAVS